MTFIKCPCCGDVIPLLVTSCPRCHKCPSCGRRNRHFPAKCSCNYPESEIAIACVTEYYGVPDAMVEVEKRRFALRRSFRRQIVRACILLVLLLTAVSVPIVFMLPKVGMLLAIMLMFGTSIAVWWALVRRHIRLLREASRDPPNLPP
jgi:Flp pilus assembly protein TadB